MPKVNPAEKVEQWPIDKLIPYARNSRTHSDEQISQIAASIKEWGFTTAVLVGEDGGIIAGHGRVMAARKLGITEIPVMVAKGWSGAQKKAYIIADNKLASNAGWDTDMLKIELGELSDIGFDVEILGFDAGAVEQLLVNESAELGLLPEDKLDGFLSGDVKILRLAYDEQQFADVTSGLQLLQKNTGVEDFSTIVLDLVLKACRR